MSSDVDVGGCFGNRKLEMLCHSRSQVSAIRSSSAQELINPKAASPVPTCYPAACPLRRQVPTRQYPLAWLVRAMKSTPWSFLAKRQIDANCMKGCEGRMELMVFIYIYICLYVFLCIFVFILTGDITGILSRSPCTVGCAPTDPSQWSKAPFKANCNFCTGYQSIIIDM